MLLYKKLLLNTFALASLVSAGTASAVTFTPLNPLDPGFTYSVFPADDIRFADENINPQSPANIQLVTENEFGLTPGSLTLVSACESAIGGCTGATGGASDDTNTFVSDNPFNYLAIHFGQAELLFYWADAITNFSFTDTDEFVRDLSNYRAYSDGNGVSEVPLPAAAWLLGSALLGFAGFKRKSL